MGSTLGAPRAKYKSVQLSHIRDSFLQPSACEATALPLSGGAYLEARRIPIEGCFGGDILDISGIDGCWKFFTYEI